MQVSPTWLTTTARVAGLFLSGRHRKGRAKSSALAGRATKGGCSTMMLMEPPPSSRRDWCIRAFTVSWNQQRSTLTGRGAVGVHRDFRRGRSGHDQPRDFKGFRRTMSPGVCERHTCGESWGRVGAGRKSEHGEWHPPFHRPAASPRAHDSLDSTEALQADFKPELSFGPFLVLIGRASRRRC